MDETGFDYGRMDSIEYQDLLTVLLKQLPPYEARIVRYKLMQYTSAEIAVLLRIAPASVRIYWMRARKRLRNYIQGLGAWADKAFALQNG